jgi:hypothetical protein
MNIAQTVIELSLEDTLRETPQMYELIRDLAIVIVTGAIQKDREGALRFLRKEWHEGVQINQIVEGNMRKIYWTFEGARYWQYVTELPVNYTSFIDKGILGLINPN